MAKVRLRLSYGQDAAFLVRLQEAVVRDKNQSKKWKEEVSACLEKLIVLFVKAKQ